MSRERVKASAYDIVISEVYHPKVRPGFACWVGLWRGADGKLMLAFNEQRREPNPNYKRMSLDFWESVGLPLKYQISLCGASPDIVTESVIMRSDNEGKEWKEIGRSDTGGLMMLAYTSLANGNILRGSDNNYVAFTPEIIPQIGIQKSIDNGNTWSTAAVLLERDYFCYSGSVHRLKRLQNNTVACLFTFGAAFGPGRPKVQRHTRRPNVIREGQCGLWISRDNGKNWSGPLIVLPAINADEPDFVELPRGDLLILNSVVQAGPQVRQYVHRTEHGFIPGPVYKVVSGRVPETVCVTKSGLLVGASRGSPYTCSNDEGATWHRISGLPNCEYQPQIIELKDGRFLCAWHKFGDCFFGEHHQYVGQHVFRLEENLPAVTALGLTRDLNQEKTRYRNSFTASLSSGQKGLPDKRIKFSVQVRYRGTYDLKPPAPAPREIYRTTDRHGHAHIHLAALDQEINIHQGYEVKAYFTPARKENLSSAESNSYYSYAVTAEKGCANNYPLYVAGQKLFVAPEALKEFPEIKALVKHFAGTRRFEKKQAEKALKVSGSRLNQLTEYLRSHNLLRAVSPTRYEWNYKIGTGLGTIEVKDDFI